MESSDLNLQQLDHVAIRVLDLERSALWYEHTLGLKRLQPAEWGSFPIMMLAGTSGIALFPVQEGKESLEAPSKGRLLHFAFRISREKLALAMRRFKAEKIDYEFQDLYHFHSIFLTDPDGYQVELTAQVKNF